MPGSTLPETKRGRPAAFAPGYLGVRKAIARWFSEEDIWPEARVREAVAPFGQQANLAVHYLLAPAVPAAVRA